MFLPITPYHLLTMLLAVSPVLSTSQYRAHIRLYNGLFEPTTQDCIHIPPGVCCRQLTLPGSSPTRFNAFSHVVFLSMDLQDLALVWTTDRPAPPLPPPPGEDDPADVMEAPILPSLSGCGGRVLASSAIRRSQHLLAVPWSFRTEDDAWDRSQRTVTGASYIRLDSSQVPGLGSAEGIRGVLGGGGKMFGVKNRTGIAAYRYEMIARRGFVPGAQEEERPAQWVWPDRVAVNGTEYAQVGGKGSLTYQSGSGEVLDLGPWYR